MTKKAVRSADRQLAKLAARKERELARASDPEALVEIVAVLAEAIRENRQTLNKPLSNEERGAMTRIKHMGERLEKIHTRADTLEAAIRSGRFASLDDWE